MPSKKKTEEEKTERVLLKRFGTTDWGVILGADVLNGLESINHRFRTKWGISQTGYPPYIAKIPKPLLDNLQPLQHELHLRERKATNASLLTEHKDEIVAKREATNLKKYGYRCCLQNKDVRAKGVAVIHERYSKDRGSAYFAWSTEQVDKQLVYQDLERLSDIPGGSLYQAAIHVKCKKCGKEFDTHLITGKQSQFKACDCSSNTTRMENKLRAYINSKGIECHQLSSIDWMGGRQIDIFIPSLSIGFEINGYATHNSKAAILYGKVVGPGKSADYHYTKSASSLAHGIKLYHLWHNAATLHEFEIMAAFIDAVLQEQCIDVNPGDKVDRDTYPDPTEAGLPYTELPPEPFDSPYGVCYNSGYWQF